MIVLLQGCFSEGEENWHLILRCLQRMGTTGRTVECSQNRYFSVEKLCRVDFALVLLLEFLVPTFLIAVPCRRHVWCWKMEKYGVPCCVVFENWTIRCGNAMGKAKFQIYFVLNFFLSCLKVCICGLALQYFASFNCGEGGIGCFTIIDVLLISEI